jgi:CheY-like chemotaxis protein
VRTGNGVRTILVVDDDHDMRQVVGLILEHAGYRVAEAEDGFRAMALLGQPNQLPDLVLLDLIMPRMSGEEVLASLRAQRHTQALPVIVLSASSHSQRPPGANAYLQKPISAPELVAAARRLLDE